VLVSARMNEEFIKAQTLTPEEQQARRTAKALGIPAPKPKPKLSVVKDIDRPRVEGVRADRGNPDGGKGRA
jgi:hypothetical protein